MHRKHATSRTAWRMTHASSSDRSACVRSSAHKRQDIAHGEFCLPGSARACAAAAAACEVAPASSCPSAMSSLVSASNSAFSSASARCPCTRSPSLRSSCCLFEKREENGSVQDSAISNGLELHFELRQCALALHPPPLAALRCCLRMRRKSGIINSPNRCGRLTQCRCNRIDVRHARA